MSLEGEYLCFEFMQNTNSLDCEQALPGKRKGIGLNCWAVEWLSLSLACSFWAELNEDLVTGDNF